MSVPATFSQTYVVVAAPADATETVIASLGGVCTQLPGQSIKLHGWANIDVGTGATHCRLNIRKTNVAGDQVGNAALLQVDDTANADGITADVYAEDPSETVSGATYVLTVVMTGASGTSVIESVFLEARVD